MEPRVFVNRTLNLKKIKYFGMDMDHTLVRYNSYNFEYLAFKTVLRLLIDTKGYPKEILSIPFDYDRTIRGLVLDMKAGNVLKLNRHGAIRVSYHGTRKISFQEQKKLFQSTYIDLGDPNYYTVDTAFSIALTSLFMDLVQLKDTQFQEELPAYEMIALDLIDSLDLAHRDNSLKNAVLSKIDDYIIRDPEVATGLERMKKHGKVLFLITNSYFHYTKALLEHTLDPYLKEHSSWMDLFEIVITGAQKPRFFGDRLNYLKVNPKDGTMTIHDGPVNQGIFYGGNASTLIESLDSSGEDILYLGDHIYGDVLRLKKDSNWRTGLVLEELGDETRRLGQARPLQDKIAIRMAEKKPFETELLELQTLQKEGAKVDKARIDELKKTISKVDEDISKNIEEYQKGFNKYWGEVMRTGSEESYFASQVERYACIYMSEIKDLLTCSPRSYFRAEKRPLPHELYVPPEESESSSL